MNSRHLIVFDTETTGLSPEDGCEIVQIAAKAIHCASLDNHHAGEFAILIKPQRPESAQDDAIKVIGPLWEKAQREGVHPKVALQEFINWVKSVNDTGKASTKPMFVGHNVKNFDMKFLNSMVAEYDLIKSEKDCPWHYSQVDTQDITWFLFESDPSVMNMRLDTLLGKLNMARATSTHDALEDVRLTSEAFIKLLKWMRTVVKNSKKNA